MATRKASGEVLAALYPVLPELWGGSADLAESNNTTVKGEPSFLPADRQTKMWSGGPYGRTLHFGIREHAMGAIMNGIALHGGTRVYGGTFLVFSDYMRGAVRLAALMQLPVIYVWTHDSIGLGEDGPTHQPIEHLAALRAIPGLDVVRPADANETAVAWRTILEHNDRPAGLALSRQNLPVLRPHELELGRGRRQGRATCWPRPRTARPEVILHRHRLRGADRRRRPRAAGGRRRPDPRRLDAVLEWFADQDQAYQRRGAAARRSRARVSVEAGVPHGLARVRRRRRPDRRPRRTTAPAPPTPCCTSSSASPPTRSSPRRARASRRPSGTAVPAGPVAATGGLPHPTGDR